MAGLKDTMFGDQPAPFVYPSGAGHRGVGTSVKAAASMLVHVAPAQKKILAFLQERGDRGAMYTDIVDGTGLSTPTVCGRLVELRNAVPPLVRIASFTRKTPSGRDARVYLVA